MNEGVPAHDKVHFVQIIVFDIGRQSARLPERTDHLGLGGVSYSDDFSAAREKGASALFVVLAGVPKRRFVALLPVDVRLVTAHQPGLPRNFRTAVVDSTVPLRSDAVLELELKIASHASTPNDKRVLFEHSGGSDFADQNAVLNSPIHGIAFP